MVEEKYKLGVEFEVDESSLDDVSKKIALAVTAALKQSMNRQQLAKAIPTSGEIRSAKLSTGSERAVEEAAKELRAAARSVAGVSKVLEKATAEISQSMATRVKELFGEPSPAKTPAKQKAETKDISAVAKETKDIAKKAADAQVEAAKEMKEAAAETKQAAKDSRTGMDRSYRAAEKGISSINKSISEVFKGASKETLAKMHIPQLAKGETGGPILRSASGVNRAVGLVIEAVEGGALKIESELQDFSRFFKNRLQEIKAKTGGNLDKQIALVRDEFSKFLQELEPVEPLASKPLSALYSERQARLRFVPKEEEKFGKMAQKEQVTYIAKLMVDQFRAQLEKVGLETAVPVGLAESKAASIKTVGRTGEKGEPLQPAFEIPVLTARMEKLAPASGMFTNLARMGIMKQAAAVSGGGSGIVQSPEMAELQKAGKVGSNLFRNVFVAFADIPETAEDMMLHSAKAARGFEMVEKNTFRLNTLAKGIQEGAELTGETLLGITKGNVPEVFRARGKAVVKKIEQIEEDGIAGYRLEIQDLVEAGTGSKFFTMGGIKGLSRQMSDLGRVAGGGPELGMITNWTGAIKRGALSDVGTAMATNIANKTGADPQQIFDEIISKVKELGLTLKQAVTEVAESRGLKGFTGTHRIEGGPLHGKEVFGGTLPIGRLGKEGPRPEGDVDFGRFSVADIAAQAVKYGSESAIINELKSRQEQAMKDYEEFLASLHYILNPEKLKNLQIPTKTPGEFQRIPALAGPEEGLKGTILDKDLADAFKLKLPTAIKGMEELFVPSLGSKGGRQAYGTDLGAKGALDVARQIDSIISTASELENAIKGEFSPQDTQQVRRLAFQVNNTLRDTFEAIEKELESGTPEAKRKAKEFIERFKNFIPQGKEAVGFEYFSGGKVQARRESAQDYFDSQQGFSRQSRAIRDILGIRREVLGPSGTQATFKEGELFKNADTLQKVMAELGITAQASEEELAKLEKRLERQIEVYQSMLGSKILGRGGDEPKLMEATKGAEFLRSYSKVLSAPVSRLEVLDEVEELFGRIQSMGGDIGEASQMLEKAKSIEPVEALPQGYILIHEDDLKAYNARARKMGAEQDIRSGGVLQTIRYPITGAGSFIPRKVMTTTDPEMRGKSMIPSIPQVMEAQEEEKLKKPLQDFISQIVEMRRQNPSSVTAEMLQAVNKAASLLDRLEPHFEAAMQNLDFDGDAIEYHGFLTKAANKELEQFRAKLDAGTTSVEEFLRQMQTRFPFPFRTGSLENLDKDFMKSKARVLKPGESPTSPIEYTGEAASVASRKLVAGKFDVGLLSDAYNSLQVLAKDLAQTDETVKGALSRLMLNINQSLGQKHVAAGPGAEAALPGMTLLSMLGKTGGVSEITSQMGSGGIFENLGKENEELRQKMKERLSILDFTELGKMAGRAVSSSNWQSVVEDLVNQMDFPSFFKKLQNALMDKARSSFMKQGMSPEAAEDLLRRQMQPKAEYDPNLKKKIGGGLNIREILGTEAPDFAATRRSAEKMLGVEGPAEAVSYALKNLTGATRDVLGDFSGLAASAEATGISFEKLLTVINAFTAKSGLKFMNGDMMKKEFGDMPGGAENYRGMFDRKTTDISLNLSPFLADIVKVLKIAFGFIFNIVKDLFGTFKHENVHKNLEKNPAVLDKIVSSFSDKMSPLGANKNAIIAALIKRPDVKETYDTFAGAEPGEKKEKLQNILMRQVAHETLATAQQPRKFDTMFSAVPEKARDAIKEMSNQILNADSFMGNLVKAVERPAHNLASVFGSIDDAGDDAADALGQMKGRVKELFGEGGQKNSLASTPESLSARDRLGKIEASLVKSRLIHGLTPAGETPTAPGSERLTRLLRKAREGSVFGSEDEEDFKRSARIENIKHFKQLKSAGDPQAFHKFIRITREFQLAEIDFWTGKAQGLDRALEEMESSGRTGTQDYRERLRELEGIISKTINTAIESLRITGKGKGRVISPFATMEGKLIPEAREAGIVPGVSTARELFARSKISGSDELRAGIAQGLNLDENIDEAKRFKLIWESLKSDPESFTANLARVEEITAKLVKLTAMLPEQYEEVGFGIDKVLKNLRGIKTASKDMTVKTPEDIALLEQKTATTRRAAMFGKEPVEAIEDQIQRFKVLAEEKRKVAQITFESTGMRTFEPLKQDLVDPSTGKALAKLQADFELTADGVKVSYRQMGEAAKAFGAQIGSTLRRVVQWGAATGIVYGTIRAFRALSRTIVEVQNGIFELQKVMDPSITDFNMLQDSAVQMAREMGVPIKQVVDGMIVFGQQGLEMSEVIERTRVSTMAMNVTTMDAAEATEALTAVMKVFGDEAQSSQGYLDSWAYVAARHAITAEDLADAMKKAGAAAQSIGLNFHELGGITAAIGSATRQTGKEIGTSLRYIFRSVTTPTAQKQLAGIGVSTRDLSGDLKPFGKILEEIRGKWDGLSRSQQITIAQAVSGTRHYNSFLILMQNFDEALQATAESENAQGFATQKNALAMQTFAKNLESAKVAVQGLAVSLGKAVLPAVTGAVKAFTQLVDVVAMIPEPLRALGVIFGAGGLATMWGLDKAMDTLMLLGGESNRVAEGVKKIGVVGTIKALPGKIGDFFSQGVDRVQSRRSFVAAADTAGDVGDAMSGLGASGKLVSGLSKVGDMASSSLIRLGKSFGLVAAGVEGLSVAMSALVGAGVLGAVALAFAGLYAWHTKVYKSGKEVEDMMADQVGVAMNNVRVMETQGKALESLGNRYERIKNSLEEIQQSPTNISENILGQTFKSPALELAKFREDANKAADALFHIDPSYASGIDDTGKLIMSVDGALKLVSSSAADAERQLAATFHSKVIKEYLEDATKGRNIFETIFGRSALGDLNKSIKEAQDAFAALNQAKGSGASTEFGFGGTALDRVKTSVDKVKESYAEVYQITTDISRVLNEIPQIQDRIASEGIFNKKEMQDSFQLMGRMKGTTTQDISLRQMFKNSGLGGVVGRAGSMSEILGAFEERGIAPDVGGGIGGLQAGSVAVLNKEFSEKFGVHARTALVGVDQTGQKFLQFVQVLDDGTTKWSSITESSQYFNDSIIEASVSMDKVRNAVQSTQKLLSVQAAGAGAGISFKGQVQLGAARFSELSSEEKLASRLPEQYNELFEIQEKVTNLVREHNEAMGVSSDALSEDTESRAKNSQAIKVVTRDVIESFTKMQREAFQITAIFQFQKAMDDLSTALDQAARAARDAAIEEENRFRNMTDLAGSLAGMSTPGSIDLGKSRSQLSPLELLTADFGKEIAETIQRASVASNRRQTLSQDRATVLKAQANFEDIVKEMSMAEGRLNKELMERAGKIAELSPEQQKFLQLQHEDDLKLLQSMDKVGENTGAMKTALNVLAAQAIKQDKEGVFGGIFSDFADTLITDLRRSAGESTARLADTRALETDERVLRSLLGVSEYALPKNEQGKVDTSAARSFEQFKAEGKAAIGEIGGRTFDEIGKEYVAIRNQIQQLNAKYDQFYGSSSITGRHSMGEDLLKREILDLSAKAEQLKSSILSSPEAAKLKADVGKAGPTATVEAVAESNRLAELEQQKQQTINDKRREMLTALAAIDKQLKDANDQAMRGAQQLRMAQVITSLYQSLENVAKDMQKAEMLEYNKIGSVLEGPFSRVGKPGFKTDFEIRRDELAATSMRPMSMGDFTNRTQEMAKIDFDEREATIQQQQEVEVGKLRRQQADAERMRSVLADAISEGELPDETLSQAQSFFDTLTEELINSEQAKMKDGELFFEGIPSLEEVGGLIATLKEQAKEKAQSAQLELMLRGNQPLLSELQTQTQLQKQLVDAMSGSGAAASEEGGVTKGKIFGRDITGIGPTNLIPKGPGTADLTNILSAMEENPQVGRTNNNLARQNMANHVSGTPVALASSKEAENGEAPAGSIADKNIQRQNDIEKQTREDKEGGVSKALEELAKAISDLKDAGIKLPESVITSLSSIGEDVSSAITDSTFDVNVLSVPSITIANVSEFAASIGNSVQSVGAAAITELENTIRQIEGDLRDSIPNSIIEARDAAISASKEDLESRLREFSADQLSTVQQAVAQAETFASDALTKSQEVETKITDTDRRLSTLQTDFGTLSIFVNDTKREVENLSNALAANKGTTEVSVGALSGTLSNVQNTVNKQQVDINNLKTNVEAVLRTANLAMSKVMSSKKL